jgi:hypothetical protein
MKWVFSKTTGKSDVWFGARSAMVNVMQMWLQALGGHNFLAILFIARCLITSIT